MTVRFANRTGSVSESDGLAILTVVREGDANIPVTVTVTTSDGTATGNQSTTQHYRHNNYCLLQLVMTIVQ